MNPMMSSIGLLFGSVLEFGCKAQPIFPSNLHISLGLRQFCNLTYLCYVCNNSASSFSFFVTVLIVVSSRITITISCGTFGNILVTTLRARGTDHIGAIMY